MHNKYTGGTGQMDDNVARNRTRIRGKRRRWSIFTWMLIDVVALNSELTS